MAGPRDSGPRPVALITARGGSAGLPGKNIADLGGRPLIAWTVEAALGAPSVMRVIVSTDSEEIAEAARRAGAEVPFLRPAHLATSEATSIDVALHALDWLAAEERPDGGSGEPEWLLLLQPTSPFRTAQDIEAAIALVGVHPEARAVLGVREGAPPNWLLRVDVEGRATPWIEGAPSGTRRQDEGALYVPNGAIYLARSEALRRDRSFRAVPAYAYLMPPDRSLDIDTAWDLEVARATLTRQRPEGAPRDATD